MHHASIKTADIHRAVAFYEQLGFEVKTRFTAGITLACWMEGLGGRIELMQVPEPRPALDAFVDEHYTGYYHLSFDLSDRAASLPQWLDNLQQRAKQTGSNIHVLLAPQQQQIGDALYEVAFLADTDGLPLEFLRRISPASHAPASESSQANTSQADPSRADETQTEMTN
ncbi:MAG: VOC family protein [Cyanobacteria bacterium P01_D01_bin.105]